MLYILAGLASGVISGMGIGGGAILIPALVFFMGMDQHGAQGINLVFFIPTAVIALIIHIRNHKIDFRTAIPVTAAGFAGAFFGSQLAVSLSSLVLRKWFGAFLLIMGFYEMIRKSKKKQENK
jgi:uncharacterized membrane protein YfcA